MSGRYRPGQVAMVIFSTTCALLPCQSGLAEQRATTAVKSTGKLPGIVVILTDDQGWGDLSCHGNTNLATPNIDSLAHDGAAFEYFYVCPVCAPTRAEFLTGRYYHKTGVSGVSRGEGRLNADETTIGNVFDNAGYAVGCFGKWHNGTQPPLHPNFRGFDEFYGFTSGHWGHYFSPPLDHNGRRVRGNGYVADDFTDHAIRFIERNKDKPFFCYLPFNTPHSPMMVSDRFYKKFDGVNPKMKHRDPKREDIMMTRAALAMCENIDWNVGRLLKKLNDLNLADDTIVVFFCDNGPNSYRWNGGLKGRKGSVDEGGVRSPCFIRWPGRIAAGKKVPQIAAGIDLLPTLSDLAGVRMRLKKPLDGASLVPLLTGEIISWPDRVLFSTKQKQGQVSVRNQRFRLDPTGQLFDIKSDPGQSRNVAEQFPEIAARLASLAKAHRAEVKESFAASANRPFHVGFGPSTSLPARDGVPHGNIQRSSKAPNNSFFTNWTGKDDSITWNIVVADSGEFEATVWYTCAAGNEGCTIQLGTDDGDSTQAKVTRIFDPPLYDKALERVEKSHYFVKDFKPLKLGAIMLRKGRQQVRLSGKNIKGKHVVDVHFLNLVKIRN